MASIAEWCIRVHDRALARGWWDKPRAFPEIAALIHSEVSEALEEYRAGWTPVDLDFTADGKPVGLHIELADTVIRIMDYCAHVGIDLEATIELKHAYNLTRPYRHEDKLA